MKKGSPRAAFFMQAKPEPACCAIYLRTGGTSVQEPWATSAAMPMDSPRVGWGWMVLPMSTVLAPISVVSATSRTMSPPKMRPWLCPSANLQTASQNQCLNPPNLPQPPATTSGTKIAAHVAATQIALCLVGYRFSAARA